MATKPLPMFLTDKNGRPAKGDESSDAKLMIEAQKDQLTVLTDIRGLMKNIADNIFAGMVVTLPSEAMDLLTAPSKANALATKVKEREAGLGKDEKEMSPLGKLFQEYFGGLKRVVTIITAVLIPFLLGFLLSFVDLTKPLDLLKAALTGLAVYIGGKFLVLLAKNWLKGLFMGPKVINAPGSVINAGGIPGTPAGKGGKGGRSIPVPIPPVPLPEGAAAGGMLTKLIGAFKGILRVVGKLFIPLTIIMGIFDGIMGAIEGFKEGGIIGAFRGALVGIVDGLIGWLVGIGQFIVSGLLDLFGFEDAAKIVEEFNFKEFLDKYMGFLNPIVGFIDLFDETSLIRKNFDKALQKVSGVSDFVSNIWEDITEAIKGMFIKLVKAIPGGSMLLSVLGFKVEPTEKYRRGGAGSAEDTPVINNAIRRLEEQGADEETIEALEEADDIKDAKRALIKNGYSEQVANDLLGIAQATPTPTPVPPANRAEELDKRTEEARAKPPEKPQPAQTNTTVVNAPNNIRSTTNMNQAPHADRMGIGSKGNAGYSGFSKAYT
jgi:hypothetical protein